MIDTQNYSDERPPFLTSRHNRFIGKGLFPRFRLSNSLPLNYVDGLELNHDVAGSVLFERCRAILRVFGQRDSGAGRHRGRTEYAMRNHLKILAERYTDDDGREVLEFSVKHHGRLRCRIKSTLIEGRHSSISVTRWRAGDWQQGLFHAFRIRAAKGSAIIRDV